MSGTSYDNDCPNCGGQMLCYSDYKPFDTVGGECVKCGFTYWTKAEQMSLRELNDLREDNELPKLKKLPKMDKCLIG